MRKLKPGKTNKEDRMNFVRYWAEYVRTHDDEDWSKQQKVLIDSQLENSKNVFKSMFGTGEDFKVNARKYLGQMGLIKSSKKITLVP